MTWPLEQRWPRYAGRALGYGVVSSLSYPTQVQNWQASRSAEQLYSRDPGFFRRAADPAG